MSFLSIASLCDQRRKQQQTNYLRLPPRIESQTNSPYLSGNVTKMQLDMRRKAEVLQYNHGNTKVNQMTKKERFALVMKGKTQSVSKSYISANAYISNVQGIVLTCNNTNLPITTPSSACGVPNDYINNVNTLYLDPNVELYNYINPVLTRSYGINNPSLLTNVILNSNYTNINTNNTTATSSKISTVEFTEAIVNQSYKLTFSNIPLALNIYMDISGSYIDDSGKLIDNNGTNVYISGKDIHIDTSFDSIQIKSILLNTVYNNQIVTSDTIYTYDTSKLVTNYTVDISTNANSNSPAGSFFIGYLSISNITLFADPGYFYDFQLLIEVEHPTSIKISEYNTIENISAYVVANVTSDYLINNTPYHCELKNTLPIPDTLGIFTITAV